MKSFTLLVAAIAVLLLSACTTTRYVPVPPPPLADRLPAQLLSCRGRPTPGALDLQSDVARYVVELDAAGADCRRKLSAIHQIVREDAVTLNSLGPPHQVESNPVKSEEN